MRAPKTLLAVAVFAYLLATAFVVAMSQNNAVPMELAGVATK